MAMTSAPTRSTSASTLTKKAKVGRRFLENSLIANDREVHAALVKLLDDPERTRIQDKSVASALKGFLAWHEKQGRKIASLSKLAQWDVDSFIDSILGKSKKVERRGGLRQVFNALVEANIIPASAHPVPKKNPGPAVDRNLPGIILRDGEDIVRAVQDFLVETYPNLATARHVGHLAALRRFNDWADSQNIQQLSHVNDEDAALYEKSIKRPPTRWTQMYLLRDVCRRLEEKGLIKNPFLYADKDPLKLDIKMTHILSLARKSGKDGERLLREFITDRSDRKYSTLHASALDHFALWVMQFKRIHNWGGVTEAHLAEYRDQVMPREYTTHSIRSLFPCIAQFFKFLHQRKFIKDDPTIPFIKGLRRGKVIAIRRPLIIRALRKASLERARAEMANGERKRIDFGALDLGTLSHIDRVQIALFIDYVCRSRIPEKEFKAGYSYKVKHFPKGRVTQERASQTVWAAARKYGLVEYAEGRLAFTQSFANRMRGGNLSMWAKTTLADHDRNRKRRFQDRSDVYTDMTKKSSLRRAQASVFALG